MYRIEKNNEYTLTNRKQFEKIVLTLLIIGITILSGFIIYYLLTPEPGFVVFGLLNSKGKAENYPTEAKVGDNISFYVTVENYLNRDFTFKVEILKGDENTNLSSTGYENALSSFNTTQITKKHSEIWISEMLNVTFWNPGPNQTIITVLWEIIDNSTENFNNILWLRLNIIP
ncbi:MAG: DUF1616 domain-containing protein [Candidatus Hermodarchaeota archaeon]